jgi:uncharacterized membrane protein YuzA (DUF378 family)
MSKPNFLDWMAIVLMIIGGLLWGLIGVFNFNLIEQIQNPLVIKIIYAFVGAAGIWGIVGLFKMSKK